MPLSAGTRLGVYEITAKLGEGGMGEVYRARDTKLARDVALKVLPADLAADRERVARFQREARTLASLNHPHIAQIYGFDEADSTSALVMELVEGEDLADRLKRGAIPWDEVLPIARQIADALEAAHEQGIIHRDLKPANIKLRPDGTVKVLDFGLAKALETGAGIREPGSGSVAESPTITTPAMTMRGVILGTAAYMAPEQAKGRTVDRRADIWAFGCVLFEMLAGTRAFDGEDVSDTLANVLRGEPDWSALASRVPPAASRVIRRCLARDPRQRARDIGDVRLQLDEAAANAEPIAVTAVAAPRTRWPWAIAVAALVAAAAIALVAGLPRRAVPAAGDSVIRFSVTPPPGSRLFGVGDLRLSFAISPDGLKLAAILRQKDGTTRVFIRRLDDPLFRDLAGTEGATTVFWAPDSERLGFTTLSGVRSVSLAGTGSPAIAKLPVANAVVSWGADDRFVASTGPGQPLYRWTLGSAPDPDRQLPAVTARRQPIWLPDAGGILFLQRASGHTAIVHQAASGEIREIEALGDVPPAYVSLAYAPGYLLQARMDAATRTVLTVQPFDHLSARVLGAPQLLFSDVGLSFSVSANGVLAYAQGLEEAQQVVWIDERGAVVGTIAPAGGFGLQNMDLSPDGRYLVTQQAGIRLVDLERGVTTTLATTGVDPVWSPDGRQIAYAVNAGPELGIYVMPAFGGSSRRVYSPERSTYLDDWSPDGKWLAGHVGTQGEGILVPLDSAAKPVLLGRGITGQGAMDETTFSPDGRWLAYGMSVENEGEVYVMPIPPTGESWRISVDGGAQPRWRADGKALYYLATDGTMMMVGLETSPGKPPRITAPQPLFDSGIGVAFGLDQYAVSRDGRRFLIRRRVDTGDRGEIQIIVNWPALLQKTPR